MDNLDAIILGIIQGFTEFLPVSSSGHLELGKAILGDKSIPEDSLLFTVVLHFATALSTIVVFRKDIWEIIIGLLKFKWNEETQFSVKIIISMIPAVIIGLLFEEQLEAFFGGNIAFVGAMLLVTAVTKSMAPAMLPGISRSGATISTSVLLGNDKSKAARFSFLMVIPLIFGKIAKDFIDGELFSETIDYTSLSLGFFAAFISGLIACTWMIKLVRQSKLTYFSIYCVVLGLIAIVTSFYI